MFFTCQEILTCIDNFILNNKKLKGLVNSIADKFSFSYSPETQFLLFYYIRLFHIHLSKETREKIYSGRIENPSFTEILEDDDKKKIKNNFIIVFLNLDNKIIIRHLSVEFCEELLYKREEVIGLDFNEVFVPKEISKFHSIYMKEFIIQGTVNFDYTKCVFALDKNLKLYPIKFHLKTLPTTSAIYSLIIYCDLSSSTMFSNYYVMSDSNGNILNISDSFEKHFVFEIKMLRTLKVDICDFFGLNGRAIRKYFQEKAKEAIPSSKNPFRPSCITTVRDEEKRYYKYIPHYALSFEQKQKIEPLVKFEIVRKDKILGSVLRLGNTIQEMGLEKEWKTRIDELYEKLKKNFIYEEDVNNFIIKFEYKMLGNFYFFLITISELRGEDNVKNSKYDFFTISSRQRRASSSFLESLRGDSRGSSLFPFESSIKHNFIENTNASINDSSIMAFQNFSLYISDQYANSSLNDDGMKDTSTEELIINRFSKRNLIQVKHQINEKESEKNAEFCSNYAHMNKLSRLLIILKIVEYLCLLFLLAMNIIYFIMNSTSINDSLNTFYTATYSFLISNDIYYGALSCISLCFYLDNLQNIESKEISRKITVAANYLINHHILFQSYLNKLKNQEEMREIYQIYNEKESFRHLLPDWTIKTKNSSLVEEIYYIHYSLKNFSNNTKCRIKERFFNLKFMNLVEVKEEDYSTNEERFIYYFFANGLKIINQKLEELRETAYNVLIRNSNNTRTLDTAFQVLNFFSALILFLLLLTSLIISKVIIKQKITYLFTEHQKEKFFFNEVKKYHNLIKNFSRKESQEYLYCKFQITPGEIEVKKKERRVGAKKMSCFSPGSEIKANRSQQRNKKTFHIKLQKSSKKKAILLEKKEITERNFEKKIWPQYIIFSIISISFVFTIYLGIEIYSMFTNTVSHKNLRVEINFTTNFLQRIPKFYELFLYAIISAINNNHLWIVAEPNSYNKGILSNYFNVKPDLETDSYFKFFGNSNYAKLYYQFKVITTNIQYLINDKKMKKYLSDTREKEFSFYEKEKFCVYVLYYYYDREYKNYVNPNDFYLHVSSSVSKCRKIGNGMNLSGYKISADLMLLQLTNNYFGFLESTSENRYTYFLSNKNLVDIEENLIYVFQYLHFTDAFLIIGDISNSFQNAHTVKIIYSTVSILIVVIIIFGILNIIFKKMDYYDSVVSNIVKMFEKAILKYVKHYQNQYNNSGKYI